MQKSFNILSAIPSDWIPLLDEFTDPENRERIEKTLIKAWDNNKIIYPYSNSIFRAFAKTLPQDIKVVILGQDPYHGQGQAMGLSFSVPKGVKIPPSLRNIFRELMSDLELNYPNHGDLSHWAEQGVLLLNSVLTVEQKQAGSHAKIGWEKFTDEIIQGISKTQSNVVFMLWGNYAKNKAPLIDSEKHLILEAAHPSPLARNKFQGSKHFSQANSYLLCNNKKSIDWKLN